jgi:hypothetical protein
MCFLRVFGIGLLLVRARKSQFFTLETPRGIQSSHDMRYNIRNIRYRSLFAAAM